MSVFRISTVLRSKEIRMLQISDNFFMNWKSDHFKTGPDYQTNFRFGIQMGRVASEISPRSFNLQFLFLAFTSSECPAVSTARKSTFFLGKIATDRRTKKILRSCPQQDHLKRALQVLLKSCLSLWYGTMTLVIWICEFDINIWWTTEYCTRLVFEYYSQTSISGRIRLSKSQFSQFPDFWYPDDIYSISWWNIRISEQDGR
jgi:hypothetical protein